MAVHRAVGAGLMPGFDELGKILEEGEEEVTEQATEEEDEGDDDEKNSNREQDIGRR
jgi:hypothetical protein